MTKGRVPASSLFTRRTITLRDPAPVEQAPPEECNVLVINASRVMAKEITIELALRIPGCSIMYAPSIELAKWIVKRRKVDLIVSSPMLPDGGIAKLRDTLERMAHPPDVLVVGELHSDAVTALDGPVYRCTGLKRCGTPPAAPRPAPTSNTPKRDNLREAISNLGADLRNDLNNPLQEIVAMVFVAQATGEKESQSTGQALCAIDRAAKNMAQVVSTLEEKIRSTVNSHL